MNQDAEPYPKFRDVVKELGEQLESKAVAAGAGAEMTANLARPG